LQTLSIVEIAAAAVAAAGAEREAEAEDLLSAPSSEAARADAFCGKTGAAEAV
jgi:hypothetical protein